MFTCLEHSVDGTVNGDSGWRETCLPPSGQRLPVLEETLWPAFDKSRRGEAGGSVIAGP